MIRNARARVGPDLDSERVDRALAALLGMSRGLARRVVSLGGAWVDGRRVRVQSRPVRTGQEVVAWWADPPEPDPDPLLPAAILLRAGGLVAVDKPAGVHSQAARHRVAGTLPDLVSTRLGLRTCPEPIHRLDADTSGVMLLGTDPFVRARASEAFRQNSLHRTYLAVVDGAPSEDSGIIDLPVERRPASTGWRVLARGPRASLLRLEPTTGRTHQLRIHCRQAGWPVLGDRRYAPSGVASRATGLCLHAWSLELPADLPGGPRLLRAPLPPALLATLCSEGLPVRRLEADPGVR
ncbi:MAG: RluA family pseudouridine synthase [Deltaproteobacteria bacterium]|nr:RluA family pseudouridine synthase [Deltaproteobacteria bacterium]